MVVIDKDDLLLYNDILETLNGSSAQNQNNISLYTEDDTGELVPIEYLLPKPLPVPNKGDGIIGVDLPGVVDGFLKGKEVYVSQSHGWIWAGYGFDTQRSEAYGAVEDFHATETINQYLLPYLENAGAAVFTTKERDMNPLMAIADNDASGYFEYGAGFEDGDLGFADLSPWIYGENPFDSGTTRRFPSNGGGIASWIPDVPESGMYSIYVSWDSHDSNDSMAHYRVFHNGGIIERYFDQRIHGSTWQYVDTLWLEQGVDSLKIELVGDSSASGKWLSADAVRIGGGMGDVKRHGVVSGRPRWEGGALQYVQFNGAPKSVYDPSYDGFEGAGGSDWEARSRWAKWEHPTGIDAVYISWHSNGCDTCSGDPRGTETYHYEGAYTPVPGSATFAAFVQAEVMNFIHSEWDPDWPDRGVRTAAYAEISPALNNEMPKALLELGFHDNEIDAWHLLNPQFRRDAARAVYRAIVNYFADVSGEPAVYLPEPPVNVSVVQQDGVATVQWDDGLAGTIYGDPPTGYRVYLSDDGLSWDNGEDVEDPFFEINLSEEQVTYIRVVSVNDGGRSFPSEIVAAYRVQQTAPILIVSGFDRLDNASLISESIPGVGSPLRMYLRQMNGYDTVVPHAKAIQGLGWGFDVISDEVLEETDLSTYSLIVWVAGEESSVDTTITQSHQNALSTYLDGGGQLFMSGSEILWDLDEMGDPIDRLFAEVRLGALLDVDSANTYSAYGVGLLDGIAIDFSMDNGAPYDVDYPDVLLSQRDPVLRYDSGDLAAVMGEGVFLMGFPFETIGSDGVRQDLMSRILTVMMPELEEDVVDDNSTTDTSSEGGFLDDGNDPKESVGACACSSTSSTVWQPIVFVFFAVTFARRRLKAI